MRLEAVPPVPLHPLHMSRIFISYRRSDSADVTGRMYDHLVRHFPRNEIFKDVDTIGAAEDFRRAVTDAIASCDVILAMIGSDWLVAADRQGGDRLTDPDDLVRIELQMGLEREIPIIPVLVRGAEMPATKDLPATLQPLAFRNALPLRPDPDFSTDIQKLIRAIETILDTRLEAQIQEPSPAEVTGSGRRWISYGLAGLALSVLLFVMYAVELETPSTEPGDTADQTDVADECEQTNPPAECLFRQ